MKENSIEEDIKILKELGQKYYKNGEIKIKALSGAKYIWALQNLLSDYKRVLKENEELKADNYELNNRINDLLDNIPVQKVKDKIKKLNKKEQELQNSISTEEREEYSDANISWNLMDIDIRRTVLQELLEGR